MRIGDMNGFNFLLLCSLSSLCDAIPESSQELILNVAADNTADIWANEVNVGSISGWRNDMDIALPSNTTTVALRAYNSGGPGAILASFSNDMVTGNSWRCTAVDVIHSPWQSATYDDWEWEACSEYGQNGISPWRTISFVSPEAQWIWTSDNNQVGYIYIRIALAESTEPQTARELTTMHHTEPQSTRELTTLHHTEPQTTRELITLQHTEQQTTRELTTIPYSFAVTSLKYESSSFLGDTPGIASSESISTYMQHTSLHSNNEETTREQYTASSLSSLGSTVFEVDSAYEFRRYNFRRQTTAPTEAKHASSIGGAMLTLVLCELLFLLVLDCDHWLRLRKQKTRKDTKTKRSKEKSSK